MWMYVKLVWLYESVYSLYSRQVLVGDHFLNHYVNCIKSYYII
jgi:hypothetical protein